MYDLQKHSHFFISANIFDGRHFYYFQTQPAQIAPVIKYLYLNNMESYTMKSGMKKDQLINTECFRKKWGWTMSYMNINY